MAFSAGAGSKRRRQSDMDDSPSSPTADVGKARPFVPRWVSDTRAQSAVFDGMSDAEGSVAALGVGPPPHPPLSREESAGSVTRAFGSLGYVSDVAGSGAPSDVRSASPAACTHALLASLLARGSVELQCARVRAGPGYAVIVTAVTAPAPLRGWAPPVHAFGASHAGPQSHRAGEPATILLLAESLADAAYTQYMRHAASTAPAHALSPSVEFDDVGIAAVAVSRACAQWGLSPTQLASIAPLYHPTLAPLAAAVTGGAAAPPIVRPALELACDGVFAAVVGVGAGPGRVAGGGLYVADWLARLAEFATAADPMLEAVCRGGVRVGPPDSADQRAFADTLRAALRTLRALIAGVPAHRTLGDVRSAVSSSALCGLPVLHAATVGVPWADLMRALRLAAVALRGAPRGLATAAASAPKLGGLGLFSSPDLPAACAASAEALLSEAAAPASWGGHSAGGGAPSAPASPTSLPPLRARLAAALVILHRADNTLGLAAALSALVSPETDAAEAFGSRVLATTAAYSAHFGGHAAFCHFPVVPVLPSPIDASAAAAAAAGTRAMLCDRLGHFGRALARLAEAGPTSMEAFKPAIDAVVAAAAATTLSDGGGGSGLRAPPGSPTAAAAGRDASTLAYASAASRYDDAFWAGTGPSHLSGGGGSTSASASAAAASDSILRLALATAASASREFSAVVAPLLEAARGGGVGSTYPTLLQSPFGTGSMFCGHAPAPPLGSLDSPQCSLAPLVRVSSAPVYATANALRVMAAAAPRLGEAGGSVARAAPAPMVSESQTSLDGGEASEGDATVGSGLVISDTALGLRSGASSSCALPAEGQPAPSAGCCDASAPLAAVCAELVVRWNSCAAVESAATR